MTVALVGPFFILNLPGCTSSKSETSKSEKITVIATLFPDILKVSNSAIFLYTGKEMEPWADKIINSVKNKNLIVGNVSTEIDLMKLEHHHHDDEQDHEKASHHEHNFDHHSNFLPKRSSKQ